MSFYLVALAGFLFVFGLVVFVHEFGHFVVAKYNDVEVEAFALGMGPKLVSYRYGETDYRVCVIPLGGYVGLAGEENPEEEADNPRAFYNQTVWTRAAVLVAGAACNLLLGYFLYVPYGMVEGQVYQPAKVGYVAEDMPAHGKLRIGDDILEINGYKTRTFQDIFVRNELLGEKSRRFLIRRDGREMYVNIDPKKITREGFMNQTSYVVGIQPYVKPVIDTIQPDGRADQLGFREGDRVVRFAGQEVRSWNEFLNLLREASGSHDVVVQRGDRLVTISLRIPGESKAWGKWASSLGMQPPREVVRYGFFESFGFAWRRTLEDMGLMFESVYRLITGQLSMKSLAGPVGIIGLTGKMATVGFWPLIRFTAFFSINLGLLNLLPIPVLDGGHIFLSIPEMITGRRLPDKVIGIANRLGLIFLLTLLVVVTYFDLDRFKFDFLENFFRMVGLE